MMALSRRLAPLGAPLGGSVLHGMREEPSQSQEHHPRVLDKQMIQQDALEGEVRVQREAWETFWGGPGRVCVQ